MGPAHVPAALVVALMVGLPGTVAAADDCPPGDWFCEPAAPAAPEPAPEGVPLDGAPPAPGSAPPPEADEEQQVLIDVENVQPAKKQRRRYHEWGVNLHAALGLMGDDSAKSLDAAMNGLGGALRYRLLPLLAFEGSVDVVWGTDYRGFGRVETAFLANAMLFVNPRSAVQLYGLVGLGLSTASVDGSYLSGTLMQSDIEERYGYFGGQVGIGLEGRITRHFVLGGDLIGFIRTRIDGSDEPEYVDLESRRTTNSSAGALIRLGATVYW